MQCNQQNLFSLKHSRISAVLFCCVLFLTACDEKKEPPVTPPKEEQIQIVTEIEARFSQIDELVENINQSLQQAEAMRQSVLKRAFEGSLLKSGKDINNS